MLDLQFSSQSKKFLNRLDKVSWNRITEKIEELRRDPFPHKVKRVEGRKEKTFRIRIGDYRLLYVIFNETNIIFISKIEKRPKAYD